MPVRPAVRYAKARLLLEPGRRRKPDQFGGLCVSRNLIEACIDGGVRNFIFSSSAAIYGDPEQPLVDDENMKFLTPPSMHASIRFLETHVLLR